MYKNIMVEQLVVAEQRLNQQDERSSGSGIAYEWLTESDLDDLLLPVEESNHPKAQPPLRPLIEAVIQGYKKAVGKLPNTDPETQEDLTWFKTSASFSHLTLEMLLQYAFAHCVSRQCLQLHHPDNDLS
ncbi:MAG: hypothetical protein Q9221_006228 [Calogaya cf. arnoldii]